MKRNHVILALSLLLVVAMLFGCANPSPGTSGGSGGSSGGNAAGGNNASQGGASSGGAATLPGKTITISTSENAIRMDPHRDNNNGGHVIKQCVFETLFWSDRSGNYYPQLAKSWEWSADWMTLTVKLREGIKFHNGNAFDSSDVIYTFDRILDPDNPYMSSYLRSFKTLESYEAPDANTVILHFNDTDGETMYNLHTLMLIDGESHAEYGDSYFEDGNLWGTGPWKFVEWVDGQYGKVVKNEEWWNIANCDSYYDTIIIRHILEPTTAVAAHLSGDINANIAVGGIGKDLLPLYDQASDRIELFTQDEGSYYYLQYGFTQPDSPFHDQNFRMAFEYAIDRQAIVDNIYGGGTVPSTAVVPITLGGQDVQEPRAYDPELAKEYLAKSSYSGYDVEFMGNTSTYRGEETLLAIADYCRKVGINAHVKMEEYASFNERRNTKNYDLFLIITMARACDTLNVARYRILEDTQGSSFVDEKMFEMIRKAISTMEKGPRDDIFRDISKYMYEIAAPHYALVQCNATYAWDKGVAGLALWLDGDNRFQYVTYDEDGEGEQSLVPPGFN